MAKAKKTIKELDDELVKARKARVRAGDRASRIEDQLVARRTEPKAKKHVGKHYVFENSAGCRGDKWLEYVKLIKIESMWAHGAVRYVGLQFSDSPAYGHGVQVDLKSSISLDTILSLKGRQISERQFKAAWCRIRAKANKAIIGEE